jgi:hypothetical protein
MYVFMVNPLLFPAFLTGTVFGIGNILSKCATAIAPMVAEIKRPVPEIVYVIIGGIAIISAILLRIPKDIDEITREVVAKMKTPKSRKRR